MQAKILTFDPFGFLKQWASIGWLETYILSIKKKKRKFCLMFVFYFMYLFMGSLCGMWGLSSLTGDRTDTPCSGSAEF